MNQYGVIILAAGSSSRLGQPKQLLSFQDGTLLQHAIRAAVNCAAGPVIVVLGSEMQKIRAHIPADRVIITVNDKWEEGIASSIRSGIMALEEKHPFVSGAILMICDQPYSDATLLRSLIQKGETLNKTIVASEYDGTLGTPALFSKVHFEKLLQLKGDTGAKKLINSFADQVATVAFEKGKIDIDLPSDLTHLNP